MCRGRPARTTNRASSNVLALVVEDQAGPLVVSALLIAKHDAVVSWFSERLGIIDLWANVITALNILLVLCLVLDDEVFAFVAGTEK